MQEELFNVKDQQIIKVDPALSIPIYRQIVDSVNQAIQKKLLKLGDGIPSVNSVASEFSIARGSIFKAYDELRSAGVIDSIPGKGFFVLNTEKSQKTNIFLLMSTFNPYREVFFNSFISKLKDQGTVDLYFHHHNVAVMETLIQNHTSHYNTFVVMPEVHKRTKDILKRFDGRRLYILDSGHKEFSKRYPGVTQPYEMDIFHFLADNVDRLERYNRTVLLFSGNMRNYGVIKGFESYFKQDNRPSLVVHETSSYRPEKGDLCIVMDDNDLVPLIVYARTKNWKLGDRFGIISYYETPLKSVISEGISTISPDFEQMGQTLANLIMENRNDHIENSFLFIDRNSF
ncbi:GntR family transcriptional regulator [Parapedobacter pyrenivorans]|uniref:GntR family transcriptional regulator n=1 Tax=Parapedobacter pyrenivorans TaxID=1305674 RepID=UPI003341196C